MKKLRTIISIFALATIGLSSCTESSTANTENDAITREPVRISILEETEITRTAVYTATLEAFNTVHMAPTSPGRVEEIYVEMGDRVIKDQVLVRMNDAQLNQAIIQLNNLEADYLRLDTLKQYGSIAQQQYDQLKAQYEVAKENVDFLSKNTTLQAPFNGIVSDKYFEAGEMYSGTPNSVDGKAAILSAIETNKLKAIVNVSEKYLQNIKNGMNVSVRFDVYPEETFSGEIYRISPKINKQSRSFEIEISINNSHKKLRPGMFGRVTINLESTNAIVLPSHAVLKMQGSNVRYLFIADEGQAKRIEVIPGQRFNDKIEVISNELKQGDLIITDGQARLIDGDFIEVMN